MRAGPPSTALGAAACSAVALWLCAAGCGPSVTTVEPSSSSTGGAGGSGGNSAGGSGGDSAGGSGGGGSAQCQTVDDCAAGVPDCKVAAACTAGACVLADAPAGTTRWPTRRRATAPRSSATARGGVQVAPLAGDVEDDGNACTLDACDGLTPEHTPLAAAPCYTGLAGTLGVGVCSAGSQTCDAQGQPAGACVGDVTPGIEACDLDGLDEDCDGQVNEQDAGCICGDGQVTFGEQCDDGNDDPTDACTPACEPPQCGDGYLHPALGEQCDDGGTSDGDPCSPTCQEQRAVFVDVGSSHSCALSESDGRVKCWGAGREPASSGSATRCLTARCRTPWGPISRPSISAPEGRRWPSRWALRTPVPCSTTAR